MAKCWACSVPQGGKTYHCGRCDCCRPMTRPDLHGGTGSGGGGASGDHSGCALWTLMAMTAFVALLIVIHG